jgi:hypothetical protein
VGIEEFASATVEADAPPRKLAAGRVAGQGPDGYLRVVIPTFDRTLAYEVAPDHFAGSPDPGEEVLVGFDDVDEPWVTATGREAQVPPGISAGQGVVWEDAGGGAFVPADLVDADDPRLSDPRAPLPHAHGLTDLPADIATDLAVAINVKGSAYGAVGNGIIDDTVAIQAAVADALARSNHPIIIFPPGDYRLTAPIIIEPFGSFTARRNITFVGSGGNNVDGGTRLNYWVPSPTATQARGMLQLASVWNVLIQDLVLRLRVPNIQTIVYNDALAQPYYSGTFFRFERVSFAPSTGNPATVADVVTSNNKYTRFSQCTWTGVSPVSVQVGEDAAAVVPNTYQQGNAVGTVFDQCLIQGAIDLRHCNGWEIRNSNFGDGANSKVMSGGDGKMRHGRVHDTLFTNVTSQDMPAIEQGTAPPLSATPGAGGLTVSNCLFRDYAIGIKIARGHALITANQFGLRNAGEVGVLIGPDADNVVIDPSNDFTIAFTNNLAAVVDQRTGIPDLLGNLQLGADYTLSAAGTVTALSGALRRKVRGGKYRVTANVAIRTAADGGARYSAWVEAPDGTQVGHRGVVTLGDSEDGIIAIQAVVALPAQTASGLRNMRLRVTQEGSGGGATLRSLSDYGHTFVQMEELP